MLITTSPQDSQQNEATPPLNRQLTPRQAWPSTFAGLGPSLAVEDKGLSEGLCGQSGVVQHAVLGFGAGEVRTGGEQPPAKGRRRVVRSGLVGPLIGAGPERERERELAAPNVFFCLSISGNFCSIIAS